MLKFHINKLKKGGIELVDVIDVRGIQDEDVKFLIKLVDFLKKKGETPKTLENEEIDFAAWPLGVKGKLTRDEIYDYL